MKSEKYHKKAAKLFETQCVSRTETSTS